jgi:hypothetical protein
MCNIHTAGHSDKRFRKLWSRSVKEPELELRLGHARDYLLIEFMKKLYDSGLMDDLFEASDPTAMRCRAMS